MTDQIIARHPASDTDEFLWLEEIEGARALAWVNDQNGRTRGMLASPAFERSFERILAVLDSDDRIPMVARHGDYLYNFWKDAEHPRGVWRRTSLDSYRQSAPDWDVVIDVDALGRDEGTAWVWSGETMRFPDHRRALISLSPDGGDAVRVREFDLDTRRFVDGGFDAPVAKTVALSWIDEDSIFIATDTGPGSLTTSSYPRFVKRWRRGQPLADAETVFEVEPGHMLATGWHEHAVGHERDVMVDIVDFHSRRTFVLRDNEALRVDVPEHAEVDIDREWLLIRPREDWSVGDTTYAAGCLLAARLEAYMSGDRQLVTLFTPTDTTSLSGWSWTRHHLLLTLLDNVSSRIEVLTPRDGEWERSDLAGAPELQSVSATGVDPDENDDFWLVSSGFLTPTTLDLGTVGGAATRLKSAPSFFDADRYRVEQHFATSEDGTRVPYFQISSRSLALDGTSPTLLYGYGGFEISLTPAYNGAIGRAWLERGGTYVVANIRGGGEYGPGWHRSALKEHRHRAYEDFAAVARDLIARGVTSAAHLACEGGSNGGLLVGNMLTRYPELFRAIACMVPLLDMKRYVHLSAGTSWIAEYGDPEGPDWAFIRTFPPYHNLQDGVVYPEVLFYTATSDDRVGPVQARKMAARMQAMGIPEVWFYENREGGHGAAADNRQAADMRASAWEFLWTRVASEGDPAVAAVDPGR